MQDQCGLFLVLVIAFVAGVYASDMRQTLLSPGGGGGVCGRRAASPAATKSASSAPPVSATELVSAQRATGGKGPSAPESPSQSAEEPQGCSGAAASITRQELVNGLKTAAMKMSDMHQVKMEDQTHSKKLGMNGNLMAQFQQLCSGAQPPPKPTSGPACAMPGHV